MSYSENQLEQVMGGYGNVKEPKVLYLTLKAKYYDMIESGFKKEEYRDIKMFWWKRLVQCGECYETFQDSLNDILDKPEKWKMLLPKDFDIVHFARGGHFHPSIPQMNFELKGIRIDYGKPEWGAEPGVKYFVISLGEIIPNSTIPPSTIV